MIDWSKKEAVANLPQHLGNGSLMLKNIGEMNIIFGPNGSGKSQFMRLLSGELPEEHHLISPERPGDFTYNASYASEEESAQSRYNARLQNLTNEYRQRVFSRLSVVLKVRGAALVPPADTHYEIIQEFLAILLPEFTLKFIQQPSKDFAIYRGDNEVMANSLSSGEADLLSVGIDMAAICLLWKLKDIDKPVMFLDEPNVHLHPDLDAKLAIGIKFLMDRFGVRFFVSSHSTSLLSSIITTCSNESRLFYMKKGPGEIRGDTPDAGLKTMASTMGGSTVLGGIFGLKLLLVEGNDDFEIWNQAIRSSNDLRLSILPPSGGKSLQTKDRKTLTSMFAALGNSTEYGYILQDRDGRLGQPRNVSDEKMPMRWLDCTESENLTLTNEVIQTLGYDLVTAKAKITEQGISNTRADEIFADRKNSKVSKDEMVIIEAALFHQNSRWPSTVGKIIGRKKPTGELADFLGTQVLDSFWGQT